MNQYMQNLGEQAKEAERLTRVFNSSDRNHALNAIVCALKKTENINLIIDKNKIDIENARKNGKTEAFIERLTLTEERILKIAKGVEEVIALPDPLGEIIGGSEVSNGLSVIKKRVPLGVIGIIFESRPEVTVDASALCLKSGNVCILRGGSDAINSNSLLVEIIQDALKSTGYPKNSVLLVTDTSRETATEMMKLNGYIDVLIPRGGAGLIKTVVQNSTVPVIETGAGNCHVFVDETAELDMALSITDNAKTQRPSVCNSAETLLVHKSIAEAFLPKLEKLWNGNVRIYADETASRYIKTERLATEEDYYTEYNDYVIALRVVENLDEAVNHINKYGTKHSEAIITTSYENAVKFQTLVDAAAVYVNASTRFTDGNVFGLGAEIGISNQKLHARGPMGLRELTTYKYLINGNGQIR